jgi:SHS2 domain-containing protein
MERYRVIDHPSDIGIEAYGKDKKELFENAAFGMMELMFDLRASRAETSFDVKVSAGDIESLLIAWLSELIYISDSKHVSLCRFEVGKMTDKELEAKVSGGKIIKTKLSVKAATYNQLKVAEEKGVWKARVIFDV